MGPQLIAELATALLAGIGFLLMARLRPRLRRRAAQSGLPCSVIIPARNEEHSLPPLLRSLAEQSVKPVEILVVDDSSTDQTAAVAKELGAKVVTSKALPEGWRGKTWACHQGAQAAKGKLLLFLDADTWFEPEGLRAVMAMQAGGALSVSPWHAVRRPCEELSLFFNLLMTLGTVPDGLFGQMLLVDRDSYWRIGGHEQVRGRILENFRLAAAFREADIPVRSVSGRGVLSMRMYPHGLRELVEGWTKGFASGATQTPAPRLGLIVAWMVGLMTAVLGGVATLGGGWWLALYFGFALQVAWMARRVGAFRWYTALLYPVPLWFFFVVFARSRWRSGKPVQWKGREIRAD